MSVKYQQEQVNELRHMILMMTGQGEKEESRGGETDERRGGENEESRGGENEENRGGENKESSSNVREKAGKRKKVTSEEGLSGGRMVEANKSREKEKTADQKKKDDRRQSMQHKRSKGVSGEGLPGGKTGKVDDRRERGHSLRQERSFADVVSQGKARQARVFMRDSIIRKVDKIVNRADDITVCKIEDLEEKAGQVVGGGTGGAVLIHVGTNNAEKERTSVIVGKYRRLIKTLKDA